MSLLLTKEEIYKKLNVRIFKKSNKELLNYLYFTKNNFLKFISNCNNCGKDKYINPLLWQLGHVIFFYIKYVLDNLNNCNNINIINKKELINFYDSYKTPKKYRQGTLLLSYTECIIYYNDIIDILEKYLKKEKITNIECYLIMLGILHNEMHTEAFIFTRINLGIKINYFEFNKNNNNNILEKDIKFIDVNSGLFMQGSKDNNDYLIFDNEMPNFIKKINKFQISKYNITEYQFLQFIKNNCYYNKKLWSIEGLRWLNETTTDLPLYWIKEDNNYYKIINGIKYSIETDLPIINISYYEAEAYCNWKNGRLPTESEYEYITTNMGTTIYPWGNKKINEEYCNINYKKYISSVSEYKKGNNKLGISNLLGNVWEWCSDFIYPYDGFKIDPVYREMSYPYFGFKKICKGGCFAVPDFLIHPKYRNAQYPDCRIQFIGFRVCRDLN